MSHLRGAPEGRKPYYLAAVLVTCLPGLLTACGSSPSPKAAAHAAHKPVAPAHGSKRGVSLNCETCGPSPGSVPTSSTTTVPPNPGGSVSIVVTSVAGPPLSPPNIPTQPPTVTVTATVDIASTGTTDLIIQQVNAAPSRPVSRWSLTGACSPSSGNVHVAAGASCISTLTYTFPEELGTGGPDNMTLNFTTNAGTLSGTAYENKTGT